MGLIRSIKHLFGKKGDVRIGLALSSGGARGFAHIGVLKVLQEEHIPIHCISGASAGALIGGLYASGTPLQKIEELAANLSPFDMARLFMPSFGRGGFIDGERVRRFLSPYLAEKKISSCTPRFACVAADIVAGERVVFRDGDLMDAIRASIAIPSIFTPATYGDMVLVDGGVVDPLPVDLAFDMGATFVIAVNVNRSQLKNPREASFEKGSRPSKLEVFMSSLMILESKLMSYQLRDTGPHMIVEPLLSGIEIHHFNKGANAILAGTAAMQEAMPRLREMI